MLRRSSLRRAVFTENRDSTKKPQLRKEVGTWLYKKETVERFQLWCKQNGVRAFNNIRITSSAQYARCLRAAKDIGPGEAIIVAPHRACFNFLVAVQEMFATQHNFPVTVNWMNHNIRVPYLLGASHSELAMAGWMTRIHSLEDSRFTPYVKWLLEDTRGRDGVSQGISKERGEETSYVDQIFSELATDACEDPEVWLEHLFRSFAAIHLRGVVVETAAIEPLLDGTDFFKTKANEIYCQTLMPLIDAVPQVENGLHNVLVDYYPGNVCSDERKLKGVCHDLQIPYSELDLLPGSPAMIPQRGFFALRAITRIQEGDYLYIRGLPKGINPEEDAATANMIEATRLMDNEYFGA